MIPNSCLRKFKRRNSKSRFNYIGRRIALWNLNARSSAVAKVMDLALISRASLEKREYWYYKSNLGAFISRPEQ